MSGRRLRRFAVSLAALGVVLYVVESRAALFHALPWLQSDSVGYLEANVLRAPVYPLVLNAFSRIPDGMAWLARFQHAAFLVTGLVLTYQFGRTFGRPLLAILFSLTVLVNPVLVSYCFTVMAEGLFVAALMAHLAFVVAAARRWRPGPLVGIGTTAALLALIRPAGYAVVAGLAVLAFAWRDRWRTLPWAVGPAAAVLLLACTGNYVVRGVFATQAQGGFSRIAYTGQFLDASIVAPYGEVARRIGAAAAPIRDALEQVPGPTLYYLIATNQARTVENLARREIIHELERERGVTIDADALLPSDPAVILGINRIGGSLANTAIRARPLAYARHVAINMHGLWWLPLIQNRDTLPALHAAIDAQLTRHPVLVRADLPFRAFPWPAFIALRALLLAVMVCGIGGLALLWSARPERRVVGYVAALLNGYFLLVSLAQLGLPRYALAVWPASMLVLFASLAVVIGSARGMVGDTVTRVGGLRRRARPARRSGAGPWAG